MTLDRGIKREDKISSVLIEYELAPDKVRSVRVGYRVDTQEGRRLLKRSWRNQEALELAYEVSSHLISRGFKNIAPIRLSKYGDAWVREDEQLYYLTDWINGKELAMNRPERLLDGVLTLVRMQSAAAGFIPSSTYGREKWHTWIDRYRDKVIELERCREIAEQIDEPSDFDSIFNTEVDGFMERAAMSLHLLEQADYKALVEEARIEGGICHRDFIGRNLIRSRSGEVYVVNLDNVQLDFKVFDLGRLLSSSMPVHGWDFDLVENLLSRYMETITLKKDDLRLLASFINFPQRMWFLGRRHYLERVFEDNEMDILQELLIEQPIHQEFMRRFIHHFKLST